MLLNKLSLLYERYSIYYVHNFIRISKLKINNSVWTLHCVYVCYNIDVAFPEKYVTENFQEIFRKFSVEPEKCKFIHNVSMKTAENTGKLLHSFKS